MRLNFMGGMLVIGMAALVIKEPVTARQLIGIAVVAGGMLVIYL